MQLSAKQQLDLTIATYEEFHNPNKPELYTKIWLNDHNFEDIDALCYHQVRKGSTHLEY